MQIVLRIIRGLQRLVLGIMIGAVIIGIIAGVGSVVAHFTNAQDGALAVLATILIGGVLGISYVLGDPLLDE